MGQDDVFKKNASDIKALLNISAFWWLAEELVIPTIILPNSVIFFRFPIQLSIPLLPLFLSLILPNPLTFNSLSYALITGEFLDIIIPLCAWPLCNSSTWTLIIDISRRIVDQHNHHSPILIPLLFGSFNNEWIFPCKN